MTNHSDRRCFRLLDCADDIDCSDTVCLSLNQAFGNFNIRSHLVCNSNLIFSGTVAGCYIKTLSGTTGERSTSFSRQPLCLSQRVHPETFGCLSLLLLILNRYRANSSPSLTRAATWPVPPLDASATPEIQIRFTSVLSNDKLAKSFAIQPK